MDIERLDVGEMAHEMIRMNEQEVALFEPEFCVPDLALQHVGANSALVDIEKGDVILGNFVKKNDELHKVGVCLLPEWLLASPKEVVDQGGDSIGECVGIKSVVQGVVAEIGIETDFDVISLAPEAAKDGAYFFAKVALDLKYESADAFLWVPRLIR